MITQHVVVFAKVYLENNKLIDSSHLKEFIEKESHLPVSFEDALIALDEMCKNKEIELIFANDEFAQYKKPSG